MNKDFYKILGVSESASDSDIKKAYRDLAKKHHPDKHPNDKRNEEKFKEISEAYTVLGNKEKRQKYDQMRKFGAGGFGGQGGYGGFSGMNFDDLSSIFGGGKSSRRSAGSDFGDLFSDLFGGSASSRGSSRRHTTPGQDIKAEVTIPFDLAVRGGKHVVSLNRGGKSQKLSINIPSGTDEGKTMRLTGQGESSPNGGPAGNLFITLHVAEHPVFKRSGLDLYSNAVINIVQAALGSKVRVTTFEGNTVELKIPAGSKSGKKLKLTGMGVKANGKSGDHIVELVIEAPGSLGKKGKQLLEQFAKEEGLPY